MKSTRFVFKLNRKKQVLTLVLIEDLGFLLLVREIQCLSTRSVTLHSWKDGISHTRGRNPRFSIGTRVRTYYSSTRERNSASFHSFRYAPLVKRRNFSHSWKKSQIFNRDSWKKSQIFNRDSCKNLLVFSLNLKTLTIKIWFGYGMFKR
jgi:hypothetical protein